MGGVPQLSRFRRQGLWTCKLLVWNLPFRRAAAIATAYEHFHEPGIGLRAYDLD